MLLVLDAALAACGVAVLSDPETVLAHQLVPMARGQGEALVPLAQDCIAEAGLRPQDLTAIAVTIGPGSFTGIRVGISAAKGFAVALDLPVLGIRVTDALAASPPLTSPVVVGLDSRRGDVFLACHRNSALHAVRQGLPLPAPEACPLDALAAKVHNWTVTQDNIGTPESEAALPRFVGDSDAAWEVLVAAGCVAPDRGPTLADPRSIGALAL
ncbi:MAG: tRNA (adenosine(37)-N6)-threonylcarbamoyltransferase complex dimerization subunit type 1 TsaB, partial [Rhodospirillaceae bacterium]